jgi:type IV secretion system protein VirB1
MIDPALIEACAPNVAVETMQAIIRVESQGDPLALAVNRPDGPVRLAPTDLADAVRLASQEIRAGHSVDIGLVQVNSKNLPALRLTVAEAFNPCTNLRAGAQVLTFAYTGAAKIHGDGQVALRAALSAYNTGDYAAGFRNGYVARYYPTRRVAPLAADDAAAIYTADPTVFTRNPQENGMNTTNAVAPPIVVNDASAFLTKGVQVAVDPAEAEASGAIEETAISEADAWDSQIDPSQFDSLPPLPDTNVVPIRAGMSTKTVQDAVSTEADQHGN